MIWTTIIWLIVGVMIIMAFTPLVLGASEKAVVETARLQAERIAAVVNSVQAAPHGFAHEYQMPKKKCTLTINDWFVTIDMSNDVSYTFGLAETDVIVDDVSVACNESRSRTITFIKCDEHVRMITDEQALKVCA